MSVPLLLPRTAVSASCSRRVHRRCNASPAAPGVAPRGPCQQGGHGQRKPLTAQASSQQAFHYSSYSDYSDGPADDEFGWRSDYASHYVAGKMLGQGSFGTVYMGVDLHTGKEVAVKMLPKVRGKLTREKTLEKLAREVDILERLQGVPNVVTLEECFEDANQVMIVTELCSGGDLQRFAEEHGPLNERQLALVATEVLKIVQGCHEAGLLHGDVKPANFCLKHKTRNPLVNPEYTAVSKASSWLKAIDFGCSQMLPSNRRLSKRTGTPVFMAPEIYSRDYHREADVWSIGVMLYQLFSRRFPFWDTVETCKASKLEEVAQAVAEAQITYNYGPWLNMSREGLDFVQACLQRDPQHRMTVQQALAHPWLRRALSGELHNNIVASKTAPATAAAPAAMPASVPARVRERQLSDVPAAA